MKEKKKPPLKTSKQPEKKLKDAGIGLRIGRLMREAPDPNPKNKY